MDLEVRHLRLVSAVAALGGLTRAGQQLNLSQSALSHQLRAVESRLGTPLFLRVGKRMVPTAAGERLVRSAAEILDALAGAEKAIHLLAGGERGPLRVAVAGHASYQWLPAVLTRYRAAHPHVAVLIPAPAGPDLLGALVDGAVDVAIGPDYAADRRLHVEPLLDDELVAAVSPSHRLAARAFVEPGDLAEETLLAGAAGRDADFYRGVVAASAAAAAGRLMMAETLAAIELAKAGLGVALVDRWVVQPLVRAKAMRAVRLTRRGVAVRWSAAMVKDLAALPHVQAFVALVRRGLGR